MASLRGDQQWAWCAEDCPHARTSGEVEDVASLGLFGHARTRRGVRRYTAWYWGQIVYLGPKGTPKALTSLGACLGSVTSWYDALVRWEVFGNRNASLTEWAQQAGVAYC